MSERSLETTIVCPELVSKMLSNPMKTPFASETNRLGAIATLLETLRATEQRLLELTGGNVDAVPVACGESRMLREAQEKLQESEERFRSLFAAAATGIAISTPNGSYLRANAAYCRMLGYTEDELRALNMASVTHPDDLSLNLRLRDELLGGKRESFFMEKRYLRNNGEVLWARASVSATHSPRGDITTLMVISEDITERKLAEEALRQSEERLRLITNLVPHGIFAKDAAGRHIFANPALAELSGFSIEEIIGKDDFELVPDKEQAAAYRADDLAVIRSGRKMVISEEPRTDLSGRTRLLQTIKVPFTLAETGETAVLGVCMDITERKRMDARFRRLVDSNVQGVFFWNTNGKITGANDAFLEMVGYTREDLDAGRMNWAEMTPPELAEQDQRALKELATMGVCQTFEKEFIRRDRSRVPIFIGPATFEDNPDEGFCFVLDLSARKKLENQFLRAQRMESIGTLAGGIAHDLNNILAPIIMSIDILKGLNNSAKALKVLKTIEVSAKRGADIVRQVLSFARGIEGQRIEVDPKHLLRDLENIIKDTFPKDIQLRFSIPNDIWTVLGDPTQVQQILLNLCVNARDAMPDGGNLTISAANCNLDEHYTAMDAQAKPGRYLNINVTDSGSGIPREIIDKIFEPFFTTKELTKGTGLGLSTVMAIVRSHGGIVKVYSEPGNGTTFKLYLPAMANFPASQKLTQQISMPRGNGETILVVDDEAAILTVTCQTLEAFGYRVLTAGNGAEAVALYAQNKNEIAVVLTDMMMPIMDGPSLIRVLVQINPMIKIVRSSGLSPNGSGNKFPEPGVKYFLTKPYTAPTLLQTMRAILEEV
jgi:PAS domain S-box-containing protein